VASSFSIFLQSSRQKDWLGPQRSIDTIQRQQNNISGTSI
jgi:hypothetical protein